MNLRRLIWKELRERPAAMAVCLLAIVLGVAGMVAIRSIAVSSEQAVAQKLERLGANVLLLPQSVSLQDYYAADTHGKTLPESHAMRLAFANLEGVKTISPKLCVQAKLGGHAVTLAGILPQSEFQAKAAWQSVKLFSHKHEGCKNAASLDEESTGAESLATRRVIRNLSANEALVGADVAALAEVKAGERITLFGESLLVSGVLPPTGTVDDSRVFAHLHTVQRLAQSGEVVNIIEVTSCCEDAAGNLVPNLNQMFPDVKVVTIGNIVETQVDVNRLMGRLSYLFVGILVLVGGSSIAGSMFSNVAERRREIGTLMALGATPRSIAWLFLSKATVVGVVGGVIGYVTGTSLAAWIGPQWAGIAVYPISSLAWLAVLLAVVVAVAASYLPALRASRLDPCLCFQEV